MLQFKNELATQSIISIESLIAQSRLLEAKTILKEVKSLSLCQKRNFVELYMINIIAFLK